MRQDIINEFIKNGGTPEDAKDLALLTKDTTFELKKVDVHIKKYEKLHKTTTYTTITPNSIDNPTFITYITNYKSNTKYTEASLKYHNTIKMGLKIDKNDDLESIDYFKGFIKVSNDGIYTFSTINNNTILIKYYDYLYFYEQLNTYPNLLRYLDNLSLDKITFEPNLTATIDIDNQITKFELLNYLFLNPETITKSIKNNKTK